jgi:hypothetical protein
LLSNSLATVLVCSSFAEFCGQTYKQEKGIPMGINPAVFMANHFLFHYECSFMQLLADTIVAHPPVLDDMPLAEALLEVALLILGLQCGLLSVRYHWRR